jgi:hypothetical protein
MKPAWQLMRDLILHEFETMGKDKVPGNVTFSLPPSSTTGDDER